MAAFGREPISTRVMEVTVTQRNVQMHISYVEMHNRWMRN